MRKFIVAVMAALSLGIAAAPASADVSVVLPPGVTQTGDTSFRGDQSPCRSTTAIAGYVFRCMDYHRVGAPDANLDGSADDTAVGLWFLMGTPFGVPVTSISVDVEVGGTVDG